MKAILEKQQRLNELSDKKIDKEKQQKTTLVQCKKTAYELEMARIEGQKHSIIEALERKEKEAKSNKARIDQEVNAIMKEMLTCLQGNEFP